MQPPPPPVPPLTSHRADAGTIKLTDRDITGLTLKKPLHIRTWTCGNCGTTHDRDVNAARNILALGRRERLNACGGTGSPGLALAGPSETGTHRGAA